MQYMHTYAHLYMLAHTYMYTYSYMHIYTHTCSFTHTCMHICIHTIIQAHIHAHTYTHTCTHTLYHSSMQSPLKAQSHSLIYSVSIGSRPSPFCDYSGYVYVRQSLVQFRAHSRCSTECEGCGRPQVCPCLEVALGAIVSHRL